MKKKWMVLGVLLSLSAMLYGAPVKINPYSHGISAGAKITWGKDTAKNRVSISFQEGTPYNSSGWYILYRPLPKVGEQLRLRVRFRATGVRDPRARATIGVQGADAKGYLGTKHFSSSVLVADVGDKESTVELVFTMPEPSKARKWDKATRLLLTVSAASTNGSFEFWDYDIEKL